MRYSLHKIILQEKCKTHSIYQRRDCQSLHAKVKSGVGRFFSVGKVFRNEKVSYKHLVEFHQVEGVATAPDASLRELMGLQKEFYSKMGIKRIKFWPTFFPYTEPSLQSMVYNEKLEK